MAILIAVADESGSGDGTGAFHYGGFVAPEREWSDFFGPAWQEYALHSQPPLEYFHTTALKSQRWRERNNISQLQAERKIDEAIRVVSSTGSLYPITVSLDAGHFTTAIENAKVTLQVKTPGGVARTPFAPDYLCFVRFALTVLLYVRDEHHDAERVDAFLRWLPATSYCLPASSASEAHPASC